MNCPRCRTNVAPAATFCVNCGFSAAFLRAHLGEHWVRIERITDDAHCLRLEEVRACEIAMDDFERHFPQAFIAVYLGVLPAGLNASELGFWLLNQGAFNTPQMMKRNDYGMVWVIDPVARSLSLTLGYALETVLDENQQRHLLTAVSRQLKARRFGQAILDAIAGTSSTLKKAGRRQLWLPQSSPEGNGIAVQPLRSGHQFPEGREGETTSRPRVKPLAPTT